MKAAKFRLTPELLVQLLHLPEGTVLRGIDYNAMRPWVYVFVEHDDLKVVPEAAEYPEIYPVFETDTEIGDPRVTMTDWGQETGPAWLGRD